VALVLELLPGGSLAALLARRGRLRPGEVVTAIAPVAAALAHAHACGVVHGDLAPGNIVFTAEGRPVLTDLGVARVLGEAAPGEVTPAYVDPTVARGGAPGPASDVFGVAAAAFHALTGIAPWNAATPADTLAVASAGVLPDLAELAPGAPAALLDVVSRGLAADPHERGSAAAFALDLRHACRPEPVRLPVAGVPDLDLGRTGRGPRTELTHEVPGRRPRPAPAIAEPARHRVGRRPTLARAIVRPRVPGRRAGVLLAVACLTGAGWLGSLWLGDSRAARAPSVAAATAVVPAEKGAAGTGGVTDSSETPVTATDWQAVVQALYARRAEALTTTSAELLTDVYTDSSVLRTADEQYVVALAAAGERLRGFAPAVSTVTGASATAGRVELELVDGWPDYEVLRADDPAGPPLQQVAGRPGAAVRMALVRTAGGWRIESAERRG
jgi:hypothetical protein